MKLLAIESAFESCSVALSLDGECRERFELAPRGHAALLLPWTEALLAEAGLGLGALDAIAFSRGPGSFTSLRIGIGVAQGLAWGAGLPVAPVSSLQATAQAAAGINRALVAMDARMQEVYCGRFERIEGLMREASPENVCAPETAASLAEPGWDGIGNGFSRYAELAALKADLGRVDSDAWPTASAVAELAAAWLSDHAGLPPEQAQPVYLRDKVAEKPARN
jgi:tRNA threonylcarbamoyladenosine biosynthesis protein TsaB